MLLLHIWIAHRNRATSFVSVAERALPQSQATWRILKRLGAGHDSEFSFRLRLLSRTDK
jgi:hypothetical protein